MVALVFLIIIYGGLPEQVGTHFNFSGTPDELGAKRMLWIMPIIMLIVWCVLTLLLHYLPKIEENMKGRHTSRMARQLKDIYLLFIAVQLGIWFIYVIQLYNLSQGQLALPSWLITVVIIIIILAFVWRWIRVIKNKMNIKSGVTFLS